MKIFVKAKPNAKEERIVKIDDSNFEAYIKEPPRQGQANTAIIRALADFLHIAQSRLRISAGHTSRKKVIEVL